MTNFFCKAYDWFQYHYLRVTGTTFFYLKAFFFGVDTTGVVQCYGVPIIYRCPNSTIQIGHNVKIISSATRFTATSIFSPTLLKTLTPSAKILIGNGASLNGVSIVARSKIINIGDGVMIAPNVVIFDSDFHAKWPPIDREHNPDFNSDADIQIGDNAWIGSQCIILKGVNVGRNSIIAAGTVLSRSVPENVVVAGSPARIVKRLALLG